MPSYSRKLLSGSTQGRTIPIGTTSTPIHAALAGTDGFDEVYAWVSNVTNAAVTLTVLWGGAGDPADCIVKQLSIPAFSPPIPILTGQVLQNGLPVSALSSVAAALNITGYVNRIS